MRAASALIVCWSASGASEQAPQAGWLPRLEIGSGRQRVARQYRDRRRDGVPRRVQFDAGQLGLHVVEALDEVGRAVEMVVCIRGDVVYQAFPQHRDRERAHGLAEAADHRACGDRAERPVGDDLAQALRVTLEQGAALRVGEDRLEAALREPADDPLDVHGLLAVRALEQHALARAEREARELRVVELGCGCPADLRARQHAQRQPLALEPLVEEVDARLDLDRVDVEVRAYVRRGHDQLRPGLDGRARHREAEVEIRGPVVEPGEDVAVKVDHAVAERLTAPAARDLRYSAAWKTAPTVITRILTSSQSDQFSM